MLIGQLCGALVLAQATAAGEISFNRDIRPILSDKCFACHGPDAENAAADLRLDLREEAIDSGAIIPGESEDGELILRVLSEDEHSVMPPAESHKPLSEREKELLVRWIAEGAEYEPHWAYTPMQSLKSQMPGTPSLTKIIDDRISERLAEEGVAPVQPADRVTVIRRLAIDLTGIPPTREEVDAFVHDASGDAYENLVDRLLGSDRYGERMTAYWLDLVRYADTVGYHGDQNVSQSPYRDYVIDAFNQNMPYDRFVTEQIAGDLLPDSTSSQLVASGYNRLNQTTQEGGAQAKEYLSIYFADRVRNVSQVFMGATIGCAQCHDHKYDPYTAKDFYSLGAFFADIDEVGVYRNGTGDLDFRPPSIRVITPDWQQRLDDIDGELAQLMATIPDLRTEILTGFSVWEAEARTRLDQQTEKEIAWVDDTQLIGGKPDAKWPFVSANDKPSSGKVYSGKLARRQESKAVVQHLFRSAAEPQVVTEDSRFFAWVHLDADNPPRAIMLQFNDGNWEHRKVWGSDEISYGRKAESHSGYFRNGDLPPLGRWVRLEVDASEVGLRPGSKVVGMAFTQAGGLVHWDKSGRIELGEFPVKIAETLSTPAIDRSEMQTAELLDYYVANSRAMKDLQYQVDAKKRYRTEVEKQIPTTVVSRSVAPRAIRVLNRGDWMDETGEIVLPAIPEFLGKIETEADRLTRLDLAKWLCQPDNPMTARTVVNRLWSLMFGRGICTSLDDFGGQGTYPSYPALLDTLAVEFIESGWDVKHIVRSIANTDAYRRSSRPTDQLASQDAYNDWFARQGRFTVDAEMVRDTALAVSGLLVEKIGGPSVRPYQPAGYYAQLNFPRRTYVADTDESQYRRGLYTHWQRTFLHPMLKAFDAPSREECTAKRARSNTPLQALVMLNDSTFLEAASVFAQRVIDQGDQSIDERIQWAYQAAVSRKPSPAVAAELRSLYEKHLAEYRADPQAASQASTLNPHANSSSGDAAELAAWTSVTRVILNLHETITRY